MTQSPPLSGRAKLLLWGIVGLLALAAGWFAYDRIHRHQERRSLQEALEAHAWSMGNLEAGKEYRLASFATPDPDNAPTFHVRMNRFHIREREFPEQPAPGVLRIIAVGDSTTFGTGVAVGERFTERLQELLSARLSTPLEVLNAGRAGMNTQAALDLVEQRVFGWKPSLLIFGTMTNDIRDPKQPQTLRRGSKHLDAYEASLERLVAKCNARNIPLLLWANTICTVDPQNPLAAYEKRMIRVAKRHQLAWISLEEQYEAAPATPKEQREFLAQRPWTSYWPKFQRMPIQRAALHLDWAHPNAFGHLRLAKALVAPVAALLSQLPSTNRKPAP